MSLYGQVGHALNLAIAPHLMRCILHRDQPAIPACTCVLAGEPAAASSLEAVLCGPCLECHYQDELERSCFQCLLERGLLPALEPPDSIGFSPMPDVERFAFSYTEDAPTADFVRSIARPDGA